MKAEGPAMNPSPVARAFVAFALCMSLAKGHTIQASWAIVSLVMKSDP